MSAREEVLGRIRAALRDVPAAEAADDVEVPRDYAATRSYPDLLGLFVERVEDYRAVVRRVAAADVRTAVDEALQRHGVGSVTVPADLPADWRPSVAEVVSDDGTLTHERLEVIDGALTGCAVGIAETGTIILDAGAAQGRRVLTLLPDYFLCVVRADQVVATVPEALARLDGTRPLTFVSGPSATSDIELQRVEGVHGPRTLDVLLVDG